MILRLLLILLMFPAPLWAAITSVDTNTAEGDSTTPGNTLALSVSDTMAVDRIGLLRVASDNVATTDGDHSEHTGVTDTVGNTYSKLCENTNSQALAAAGITGSLWLVRITVQLTAGQTINVTFANSITSRTGKMHMFSVTSGNTLAMVAGSGGCNTVLYDGTMVSTKATTAVASASTLWYRPMYFEGGANAVTTPTAGYTALPTQAATLGTDLTAASVSGEFLISTNTFETSAPILADGNDDAVAFFLALREVSATPTTRRRASPVEIN